MTRVIDETLRCPNCWTLYRHATEASVNFRGWRTWSDGWGFGELHELRPQLLGCDCGALFWPGGPAFKIDSDRLAAVRKPPTPAQISIEESVAKRWWQLPWRSPKAKKPNPWMLPPSPHQHLPAIGSAGLGGMFDALSNSNPQLDERTELEIRRWLWWSWNHAQRGLVGRSWPTGPEADDAVKRANLEQLLTLLSRAQGDNWMQIGDVCRQLGRYDEARHAYRMIPDCPAWAAELSALADRGISTCSEILK